MDAVAGIWRDLGELPVMAVAVLLPVVLGVVALRRGRRTGWAPIAVTTVIVAAWWAYYALPLPNPGGPSGVWSVLALSLLALATGVWALRPRPRRATA